jgi:hypothetical protein
MLGKASLHDRSHTWNQVHDSQLLLLKLRLVNHALFGFGHFQWMLVIIFPTSKSLSLLRGLWWENHPGIGCLVHGVFDSNVIAELR